LEKQTLPAILAYICIGDSNLNNPTQRRSGRFTRKYPRKSTGYLQTEGSSWQVEHFVELQLLEHVARFEDHVLRFHWCKGTVWRRFNGLVRFVVRVVFDICGVKMGTASDGSALSFFTLFIHQIFVST